MGENHYAALLSDNPAIDFEFQVQAEMYVLGKPLCDLFFYHPTMVSRLVTIEYDNSMTELFMQAETAFIEKWIATVAKYVSVEKNLIPAPIY